MSSVPSARDREQILDELERYYQGKLDGVRAKRGACGKSATKETAVRVRIDSERREIVLSWDGRQ